MSQPKLLVGIPTFRRPEQLRTLLRSLREQRDSGALAILVVDNDPERTALPAIVAERSSGSQIQYAQETRPGVSHVRNRILAERKNYDAIVFLDDDQYVTHGWLVSLLAKHAAHPDSVISGRVIYELPEGTPEWIIQGGFLVRPDYADGARLSSTGTGNALIPVSVLAQLDDPAFDVHFGRSGGEDTEFFARAHGAGVDIIWSQDALALEPIPLQRLTWEWVKSRYIQSGYIRGTVRLMYSSRLKLVGACFARLMVGAVVYFARRVTGRSFRHRDVHILYSGIGYMKALTSAEMSVYGE